MAMDPNSQNQRWSMWTWTVRWTGKGIGMPVTMDAMKRELSKFCRKLFQSTTGQLNILPVRGHIIFKCLVEHTDVTPTDPAYVAWVHNQADLFFKQTFGPSTTVHTEGKLMAGSPQTGAPSDQMIILPPLDITKETSDG